MNAVQIERTYAMRNLGGGVYLLPGNSGRTLYLIRSYPEDGSAVRHDGTVLRGTFWRCYRLANEVVVRASNGEVLGIAPEHLMPPEPDMWDEPDVWHLISAMDWGHKGVGVADVLSTRAEAINAALADDARGASDA